MQDAFAHCEGLVRAADKDRFLSALFAPAEHRNALLALYAFNLEIARVREVAREALAGEIRLQWWSDAVEGRGEGHPVAAALLETVARYQLPTEPFRTLIDARRFDLYDEPMRSLADLERYAKGASAGLIALAAPAMPASRTPLPGCSRHFRSTPHAANSSFRLTSWRATEAPASTSWDGRRRRNCTLRWPSCVGRLAAI